MFICYQAFTRGIKFLTGGQRTRWNCIVLVFMVTSRLLLHLVVLDTGGSLDTGGRRGNI